MSATTATTRLVAGEALHGVRLRTLEAHDDERGSFVEVFAAHWGLGIEPRQWSIVRSAAGVLRGMHAHRRHDEYVHVVAGCLSVGLHDLRPDSPTAGRAGLYVMTAQPAACLVFPRGLAHGWLAHEPTVHLQAVSEAYDDYGDDDNEGCHWADPDLGIPWPFAPRLVSGRAEGFGSLAALRERLTDGGCGGVGISP